MLLTGAAGFTSVITILLNWASNDYWLFNDFKVYWLAGRVLARGGDPYDVAALAVLAQQAGVGVVLESGYVYPIPFAVFMAPLSSLPLMPAAWLFSIASLAMFAGVTALLIERTPCLRATHRSVKRLVALAAGTYPPVACSLVVGQVNLLVYSLMAIAAVLLVSPTRAGRSRQWSIVAGLVLGVVTIVKLVPGVLGVCLLLGRRWYALLGLFGGAVACVVLADALLPTAGQTGSGLAALFEPDAWWTNQSINGFVTRLFTSTSRTHALLESSVSVPLVTTVLLTGALADVTAAVLWRARDTFTKPSGLGLGMAFALVAASIGAPKISFWNHVSTLLAVWLLLGSLPPRVGMRSLSGGEYALLAGWFFGAGFQWAANFLPDEIQGLLTGPRTLLYSSALLGLLGLWLLLAHRLARLAAHQVRTGAPERRRVGSAAILGILGCGALAAALAATALPRSPRADMALGVTFSPRYAESLTLEPREAYDRMLKNFRMTRIRLPAYWDLVEPAPGVFDFSSVDFYLAQAQQHGIAVIPALGFKVPRWPECFAPSWATQLDVHQKQAAVLDLLQAEVVHFRGFQNISEWQVENEPFLSFGACGDARVLTAAFVAREVALVHGLDSRPILITDSGEFSTWIPAQSVGDRFGFTLYRSIWFPRLGVFPYPFWPGSYAAKDFVAHSLSGTRNESVVAELQAEPWFQGEQSLLHVPASLQAEAFPPSILRDNVEYTRQAGFAAAYLWGVEWWYWMEKQGYPGYLANASGILGSPPPLEAI